MTLTEGAPGAGLWLSRDNGKTWQAFDDLPFSNIQRVEFDPGQRRRDPRHHLRRQRLARAGGAERRVRFLRPVPADRGGCARQSAAG